jgi:heme/copper-type cytochrome/quinol oxidase subunit 2
MDLISILATVILVTTIGTMVVGVGAYYAFKLRDKRKPKKKGGDETLDDKGPREPIFLTRYVPVPAIAPEPENLLDLQ